MSTAKAILTAGMLASGVLVAGCGADAGNGASDKARPEPHAESGGQPLISYDPVTSQYRFASGTLDPVGYPYSIEINHEVRGMLRTRDDVVVVKAPADAEISFRSRFADQAGDPTEPLAPGESVDLNVCWGGWAPTFSYCCLFQKTCISTGLPGPPLCSDTCVWTCWNYIGCTS